GIKIETMMEENYEYIQSEPDTKRPFQVARIGKWNLTGDGGFDMFVFLSFNKKEGGFLVPIQIKY
ncbi:218_t:CDS:1, partial [Racocetra persica]